MNNINLTCIVIISLLLLVSCQNKLPSNHISSMSTSHLDKENKIEMIKENFSQALWNERKFEIAHEIFTEDFITESISNEPVDWIGMHGKGPESMIHHIKWWLEILPDAQLNIIEAVEGENMIMETWELTGTMQGELAGIAPTGKPVKIMGATVAYFEGDKIRLHKTILDRYGLMQQIGGL